MHGAVKIEALVLDKDSAEDWSLDKNKLFFNLQANGNQYYLTTIRYQNINYPVKGHMFNWYFYRLTLREQRMIQMLVIRLKLDIKIVLYVM